MSRHLVKKVTRQHGWIRKRAKKRMISDCIIGSCVRRARQIAGLTQSELAELMRSRQERVSKLELGDLESIKLKVQMFNAACEFLPEARKILKTSIDSVFYTLPKTYMNLLRKAL